ncbi:hemicentin-1 [Astatotilapia calliptera]|uniref:hemicentin-1 n=1 Tax=Astatotilapia calliptera TaxID=8154 RepID=UPI000E421BB3|nr:hemicentin-1-like [Astatotilapia calliptera]XP_026009157.1 hemicentin-1-like [Astatotilapia calliptera]XP_026009158.1 hemicentin-1-like [Astatotilapia calliptera]XP_026009159.1 hemicentin-1-like [Astatotilapia calliptera]
MSQLRHPVSTCATRAAQWKMWLFKVFSVIYAVAVCASEDNDATTYSYRESESTAPPPFEPPVPVLERTSSWSDVFSSEKVVLECKATSSSELIITWKKDGSPLGSGPNLSPSPDKSVLTITATSTQDSGYYTCVVEGKKKPSQTKESGPVEITVYASTPKPTLARDSDFGEMFPGESITLTCSVDVSSGWEYLWHNDQHQISGVNNKSYTINSVMTQNSGQYYCQGKRDQFLTHLSESTTLKVIDPPTPGLQLQTAWKDVFEGEAVEFRCHVVSSTPGWTFTWHRNKQQLQNNPVEIINGDGSSLKINPVRQTHKGSYTCKAHLTSRGVNSGFSSEVMIQVSEIPVPTLKLVTKWPDVFPTESVNMICEMQTDSADWTYAFYRDVTEVQHYNSDKGRNLSITSASTSDGGNYSCSGKLKSRDVYSTKGSPLNLHVYAEKPTLTLTRDPEYDVMFAGEAVTFSCAISVQSEWTYLWYKDGSKVTGSSDKLIVQIRGTADQGSYTCKATRGQNPAFNTDSSEAKQLKVQENKPKPTITQQPDAKKLYVGENVSFECKVENSDGWSYDWYKDKASISNNSNSLKMKGLSLLNGGVYKCKAKRGKTGFNTEFSDQRTVQISEIPVPTLKLVTKWPDVFPTESVNMICEMQTDSADWTYAFYRDVTEVQHYNSDKGRNLSITSASTSDGGNYSCSGKLKSRDVYSTKGSPLNLHVYAEKPTLTLTQDPEYDVMFAGEAVTFSCAISVQSAWTYLWYKDGSKVTGSSDKLKVQIRGTADQGSYTCKATRGQNPAFITDSSEAKQLKVQHAPTVTLEQNPAHNLMHSEDSVSFNCHVNVSSGWMYLWYKDGSKLDLFGSKHNITSVATKDSGSYNCKVKRGKVFDSDNKIKLDVEERPKASIVLLTGWSDVFSTDSLSLKCEVKESTHNWMHYTWFKEGERIDSFNVTHTVTPSNDPDQSTYTCCAHADERPLYSKSSDSFKTKNLLLKRRVLLSISGCIVFGIAAVLIGCVALRVFRKPNGRDDKMEEVNLFPTMAELKITDVPCPLVEYITDASLNAPAKEEEEENGTVCSETTPLPITKQEDQAATTDNQETTETNGGLSSFLK